MGHPRRLRRFTLICAPGVVAQIRSCSIASSLASSLPPAIVPHPAGVPAEWGTRASSLPTMYVATRSRSRYDVVVPISQVVLVEGSS